MKWFKHDSDANTDAKLRKLRMKYGMEGYGLYWYCLELIAKDVQPKKITFALEHDAEVIAYDCRISAALVEDMMTYMVNIGLFQNQEGRIFCLKMATRMEENLAKTPQAKEFKSKIVDFVAENTDNLPVSHRCDTGGLPVSQRPEVEVEVEVDKKRDKGSVTRKRFTPPAEDEVSEHMLKTAKDISLADSWANDFVNYYESNGWKVGKNKMANWKAAATKWAKRNVEEGKGNGQNQQRQSNGRDPLAEWGSTNW